MSSILVIYGTGEGQTAKVADRIVGALEDRGHEATSVDVRDPPPEFSPDEFDAVLVGASIHAGKHQSAVRSFVTEYLDLLAAKPTAFFQISLSSATDEGREQAAGYVEEFIEDTGWSPDRVGLFGGALRYSEYGFLKRLMMKQIVKRALPDVETSGDVEFTDWQEVDDYAADVAAFLEGRLGVTPGAGGKPGR